MSRIGNKLISLPNNITLNIDPLEVKVTGPLGELSVAIPHGISVVKKSEGLEVVRSNNTKIQRSLHGTVRSLLQGVVTGVINGFEKKLELVGIGYRANVEGNSLVLNVGFTHPVKLEISNDIKVKIEKNVISVFGTDKQKVGQFAAVIRAVKKPDPYKGKGIRYQGEVVRIKQGKATKG